MQVSETGVTLQRYGILQIEGHERRLSDSTNSEPAFR